MSRVSAQHWVRAFRSDAASQQGGKCCYCRSVMTVEETTAEHVVPLSKGGKYSDRGNIKASCAACNRAKGSMTEGVFLKLIKHPEPGGPLWIRRAWMRRRIALATERACKRLLQYAA